MSLFVGELKIELPWEHLDWVVFWHMKLTLEIQIGGDNLEEL